MRVITSIVCPFLLRSFISQWDRPPSNSYTTTPQSVASSPPAPDPSLTCSTSCCLNTVTGKDPAAMPCSILLSR